MILARLKSGGRRVEAGIFLVDVFCLGPKLAVYEDCDGDDYRTRIRDHYTSESPMIPAEPCCARKLIERAAAYRASLGFASCEDFTKAARVFGGLRVEDCFQEFKFGQNGKPFYRRGPRETEEQARRIVNHLGQRLGAGNFEFLVELGDSDAISRSLGL